MPSTKVRAAAIAALTALAAAQSNMSRADPIVDGLFATVQQNSANSANRATGEILFWGANSVTPAATSWGTTFQCPIGASCTSATDPDYVRQALNWREITTAPNQYFASRPYDPTLTGAWTLRLSTDPSFPAGSTLLLNTPTIGAERALPFVESMTASGAGTTPTVSWTLPTGVTLDRVRITVFDNINTVNVVSRSPTFPNTFVQSDQILSAIATPGSNSLTLPSGVLSMGGAYSIAVALEKFRVPGDPTSGVVSRSQSFFDFTPIALPGVSSIYLPRTTPVPTTAGTLAGPVYSFSAVPASPTSVTFIDPFVATGYDYRTGAGDPNFKGVTIPTSVGDGLYDVWLWDGSGWVLARTGLGVNTAFEFGALGVDRFRITGIETSAALSPFDLTAFVTGLTFVSTGTFNGTMQAIVAEVAEVPEPTTLALLALAFVLLANRSRARARHERHVGQFA